MYTINSNNKTEIIINRSRFIGFIFNVKNKADVETIINDMNNEYSDATHVCYAYVIGLNGEIKKAFDDNEPKGTAGTPILNILEQNQLSNVIVFVVRYFGGTKLGAGGLIRAYSNCAKAVIENNHKELLLKYYYYEIHFDLSQTKTINQYILNNQIEKILKQEYFENGECIYYLRTINPLIENKTIDLQLIKHDY